MFHFVVNQGLFWLNVIPTWVTGSGFQVFRVIYFDCFNLMYIPVMPFQGGSTAVWRLTSNAFPTGLHNPTIVVFFIQLSQEEASFWSDYDLVIFLHVIMFLLGIHFITHVTLESGNIFCGCLANFVTGIQVSKMVFMAPERHWTQGTWMCCVHSLMYLSFMPSNLLFTKKCHVAHITISEGIVMVSDMVS